MKLFLPLILVLSIYQAEAQQYLVLKKRNKARLVYEAGDRIKFQVKGE